MADNDQDRDRDPFGNDPLGDDPEFDKESEALQARTQEEERQRKAERLEEGKPVEDDDNGGDEAPPVTLAATIAVFDTWLKLDDKTPIYAVLGTVAANLLPGDPVWTGLIAPPSSAKTELLNSLRKIPKVISTGTITMPGLLSGSPLAQSKRGKGGILRQIGNNGILVFKDFGSILSMRPEAKAELLAAFREIYDGKWTRHLGVDGGRELTWTGKLGLIFGATEAYDDHYSVISALGDRSLLCRLPSDDNAFEKAMIHDGPQAQIMREELADTVATLFRAIGNQEPTPPVQTELARLKNVVRLATRLRAHVTRDTRTREIDNVHYPEGPGRLALALRRLFSGLVLIGVKRSDAMDIIERIALDSVPPIRLAAFSQLEKAGKTTRDVARLIKLPTTTTRRALQELTAFGLAIRFRKPQPKQQPNPDTASFFEDPAASTNTPDNAPDLWRVGDGWEDYPEWCVGLSIG
jgi:hypothetical protein